MDSKSTKIRFFKKRINAPKDIIYKMDNGLLELYEYFDYELQDHVTVESFLEKYRPFINKFSVEECPSLDWEFINSCYDWCIKKLETFDGTSDLFNDYLYDEAFKDITGKDEHLFDYENATINLKNKYPEYFLDDDVNEKIVSKYYTYSLTISDYIKNFNSFKNKKVTHTLFAGDYFKNIINNISEQQLNEFIEDNLILAGVLIRDEAALLNIISLYQRNKSDKDKIAIYRKFIDFKKIKITSKSLKVLCIYFSLDEILNELNEGAKKFIKKFGIEKAEILGVDINDIDTNFYNAILIIGFDNVIKFNRENNGYFSNNKFKTLKQLYRSIISKDLEKYKNLSKGNIDEELAKIFEEGNIYYRNVGYEFKKKYPHLFLDIDSPTELQDLYYDKLLSAEILQKNRYFIKDLITKNTKTGFKNNTVICDGVRYDLIQFLSQKIGVQEVLNLMADYGKTFDNVFEIERTFFEDKDYKQQIKNIITNSILSNSAFNDSMPAKYMLEHKNFFLDITTPNEFKELFYSKELTFKFLFNNPKYLKYLEGKDFRVCFKDCYDIFKYFDDSALLIKLIEKYGDILENVKDCSFFDVIAKIIKKNDDDLIISLLNNATFMCSIIDTINSKTHSSYFEDIISYINKTKADYLISTEATNKIVKHIEKNNTNIYLFGNSSKDAFYSFIEQSDNRISVQMLKFFCNQKTSNYKYVEEYIDFFINYKFNKLPEIFKNEFHIVLSKVNKSSMDFLSLCIYLRTLKTNKISDDSLIEKYTFGIKQLKEFFTSKGLTEKEVLKLIDKIICKKRSVLNILYVSSDKELKYVINISNILNSSYKAFVGDVPSKYLETTNEDDFNYIFNKYKNFKYDDYTILKLAFISLYVFGIDNFKKISIKRWNNSSIQCKIFLMLKYIDFELLDMEFIPLVQDLLFNDDENFGIAFYNYLNNFEDLNVSIKNKIESINESTVSTYEKNQSIINLENSFSSYKDNLIKLFVRLQRLFNEFDILEEELINNDKQLEFESINYVLDNVNRKRNPLSKDNKDKALIDSNHFNYIGYINNATKGYINSIYEFSKSINRELSSIPCISIGYESYNISTLNYNYRDFFNIGNETVTEFSFDGTNNVLFKKCILDENKGILAVTKGNKFICAIPAVRENDTLILDGLIYSNLDEHDYDSCIHLIKEASKTILTICKHSEDSLKRVLIENKGIVSPTKLGTIINNKDKYISEDIDDLDLVTQIVVAEENNRNTQIQKYSYKDNGYDYFTLIMNTNIAEIVDDLNKIKNTITDETNKRMSYILNRDNNAANKSLKKIKELKDTYNMKYKLLLEIDNIDYVSLYNKALSYIKSINKITGKTYNSVPLKQVYCNNNWYVAMTIDEQLIGAYLASGKRQYNQIIGNVIQNVEDTELKSKLIQLKGE